MDKGKGRLVDNDDADNHGRQTTLYESNIEPPWLSNLNDAQKEAVTWKPEGGLQILAGPGSGKTRVLTCRVAHLVKRCGMDPSNLIVVTFTNKAANEMKHRLRVLLGEATVSKIMMGTFHSVAVKYLRKYGKAIDLPGNFVIADQADCQSILKPIVEQANKTLRERYKDGARGGATEEIKVKVAQEIISRSKAKGVTAMRYVAENQKEESQNQNLWKVAIGEIYTNYQAALKAANTLDFDDLLVHCERLLEVNTRAVDKVQHVLVDEFQDTNTIQYNIVKLMARRSGSLTIVGDPDQSIYAWRSAEVENLSIMLMDFKDTHQVFLEENYRSTSNILDAALAVVQQDKDRIQKSLRTSHPTGPPVVLRKFGTAQDEAAYIAYEIKRAIAQSGGQLSHNDFAILLRYNALSRAVEAALQSASIPSRMIGGHKFFERAEVKDILAYLQLAENPAYTPAFTRIVNVPKRAIGDKTVQDIVQAAKSKQISCYEVVCRAVKGSSIGNIKPAQKTNLADFVRTISTVREMAARGSPVSDLIEFVTESVGYANHLERTYGIDCMTRLENINELKAYADQVAKDNETDVEQGTIMDQNYNNPSTAIVINILDSDDTQPESDDTDGTLPELITEEESLPLQTFLATSMLSTDTETQDAKENESIAKVTITTCHAAKGLEWPVVFLPAVETGVYPAFRKSDPAEIAEERRLFYVAMTRAQVLLHMTHASKRMERGMTEDKTLTEFLHPVVKSKAITFTQRALEYSAEVRSSISTVTRRPAADEALVKDLVATFHATTQPPNYTPVDDTRAYPSQRTNSDSQAPHARPGATGQGWRINAYSGEQARLYAAATIPPHRGVNKFAGAFSSAPAPGFTSALSAARSYSAPVTTTTVPSQAVASKQASFQPVRSAFSTASGGMSSGVAPSRGALNKPFKPPTMVRPSSAGASRVTTVETRLTQQKNAVILNPVAPDITRASYSLPIEKDDAFAFLRSLPKGEEDEIAPRAPGSKAKNSTGNDNNNSKRRGGASFPKSLDKKSKYQHQHTPPSRPSF